MKVTDVNLTTAQIAGNNDGITIITNVAPGYEYGSDGKRTDKQTHIKYYSVCTDNDFEKIVVKVSGTKEIISKELLAQHNGKVKVKFKNLTGKFYRTSNGEYALSCTADSVEVLP